MRKQSLFTAKASLWILAIALLAGLTFNASAALLVNLDFQDGADIGDPLTSTANSGTVGGTGIGSDQDGAGPGGVTYGAGSLTDNAQTQTARDRDRAALFVDANTGTGVNAAGGRVLFSLAPGEVAADSDWSIMAAVRIDAGNITFDRIVEPFIDFADDNDGLRFTVGTSHIYYYLDPQQIPVDDGKWHHLAITSDYDGSTNLTRQFARIYVDAVEVGTMPFANRIDFSGGINFSLGAQAPPSAGTRPFDGAIDDLRFYNELLSPNDVYGAYYESMLIPEPSTALLVLAAGGLLCARRARR